MSQSSELIYTSAPKGLRPGSRGFCTVAMSEGMPAGLVGPLENFSAYRNIEGDGPAPVNFMHVQMKVAGRPVNVLSRVGDAPPDYTGRTNKIAHHVVVATPDRAAGGPAAVLRHSGFTVDAWDGEVRKIAEPKTIPAVDSPPRVAETWAAQAGDAGWAGHIATMLESKTPGPPVYLIHRADQNGLLLAMIDEAICILPESQRWNATFSTYTSEVPPGVTCRLRCLLAGSREAAALPPSATVIDLAAGNLGAPPSGPYVDAAREGIAVSAASVARSPSRTPAAEMVPASAEAATASPGSDIDDSFSLAPPLSSAPVGSFQPPPLTNASARRKKKTRLFVAAAAAVLMLCLGGGTAFYFMQVSSNDLLAELNESAGITIAPKPTSSESTKSKKRPHIEPEMPDEKVAATETEADKIADLAKAKEKQDEIERQGAIKKLEELAKTILDDGQTFLAEKDEKDEKDEKGEKADKGERSIKALVTDTENELKLLEEKKRQLETFSLEPSDEDLSQWVRSDNWQQEPENFMTPKRKDVEALREHTATKVLDDRQKNLLRVLEDWDTSAKEWENVKEKEPDLVSTLSGNENVDQTIVNVRSLATASLGDAFKTSLDRHKAISADLPTIAEKLKNQFGPKKDQLVTDLKRRRDSHRLKIYFDGDFNRRENPLQIKPRCYIAIDDKALQGINCIRVDKYDKDNVNKSKPVTFGTLKPTQLPEPFEGWLFVSRSKVGATLELDLKSIPQKIETEYPLLKDLKAFVDMQKKTITSWNDLRRILYENFGSINNQLEQERTRTEKKLNAENTKKHGEQNQQEIASFEKKIADLKKAITMIKPPSDKSSGANTQPNKDKGSEQLNQIYEKIGKENVETLELIKENIPPKLDKIPKPDVLGPKIDDHIKNLRELQRKYISLNNNRTTLDLRGQLIFGSSESADFGQPDFTPLETFELFFIPELDYGPPPDE